ncbi:MAG: DUF721 domain-containing protein [Paramuribaculum sp.]|nr:DUF721 domain-containing protein [Paramuribaculum sp.]MDE5920767.1 DUF721 domain-containing protein [Paramuribaculum sp.]
MKRTEPQLFSEIFSKLVEQSGHSDTYAEQRACFVWPEVVGQGVNRYTTHRYVDHGVMHVYLTSASLKNELGFHKSTLIEQINRRVGRNVITSIVIH